MYTWGDGSGGKLGLGHHDEAESPQRLHTLWGQPVRHIAVSGAELQVRQCRFIRGRRCSVVNMRTHEGLCDHSSTLTCSGPQKDLCFVDFWAPAICSPQDLCAVQDLSDKCHVLATPATKQR